MWGVQPKAERAGGIARVFKHSRDSGETGLLGQRRPICSLGTLATEATLSAPARDKTPRVRCWGGRRGACR